MRTILRLLGTRYGIALILAVLVLAIVSIGKVVAGNIQANEPIGPVVSAPPAPAESVDPSLGDDSVTDPLDPEAGPSGNTAAKPSLSPGAPDATTVATRFINAWLHHTGVTTEQWHAGLKPHATPALMAKLKEADPGGVPADSVTGPMETKAVGTDVVVTIPVGGGTVRLNLVVVGGRWLVDGVDWDPV